MSENFGGKIEVFELDELSFPGPESFQFVASEDSYEDGIVVKYFCGKLMVPSFETWALKLGP